MPRRMSPFRGPEWFGLRRYSRLGSVFQEHRVSARCALHSSTACLARTAVKATSKDVTQKETDTPRDELLRNSALWSSKNAWAPESKGRLLKTSGKSANIFSAGPEAKSNAKAEQSSPATEMRQSNAGLVAQLQAAFSEKTEKPGKKMGRPRESTMVAPVQDTIPTKRKASRSKKVSQSATEEEEGAMRDNSVSESKSRTRGKKTVKPQAATEIVRRRPETVVGATAEKYFIEHARLRIRKTGDRSRVNIVSDKLCDDIISYMGSSLERHKGCDIIDLNPGSGLWSAKLHDFLQPRSHLLLEPEAGLYQQFLEPLLERPGVRLLRRNGIFWGELASVLTPEFLPHQAAYDTALGAAERQNDTLLVTANLAHHPKKGYRSFDSMVALVTHKLLDDIRTRNNFQRYGHVRMLIWMRDDDKDKLIPQMIQRRKRTSVNTELFCEHVHEICGMGSAREESSDMFMRECALDDASRIATVRRMRAAGTIMPAGRESEEFRQAMQSVDRGAIIVPGETAPVYPRSWVTTLATLKAADEDSKFEKGTEEFAALRKARNRTASEAKMAQIFFDIRQKIQHLVKLRQSGDLSDKEAALRAEEWGDWVRRTHRRPLQEFPTYRDNLHLWAQESPVLHWDRRLIEPMRVDAAEFLPNLECALIDIQPRTPHWSLRPAGATAGAPTMGIRESSYQISATIDILLKNFLSSPLMPLDKALESIWPGASDYIMNNCETLKDPERGGIDPALRNQSWSLNSRMLNAQQLEDIFGRWFEWPFRPEFSELVGRVLEEEMDRDGGVGASGTEVESPSSSKLE
jgi:mitochondrial transcription factor 1